MYIYIYIYCAKSSALSFAPSKLAFWGIHCLKTNPSMYCPHSIPTICPSSSGKWSFE